MIYKVTLTPLERFFFGGETVFGNADQDKRRRSYLVQSNILPQQTSLLGLIREQLLTQNNLRLDENSDKATVDAAINLVGKSGFSHNHGNAGYGLIQRLSALGLEDSDSNTWQVAPVDDRQMPDSNSVLQNLKFVWDEEAERPLMQNLNPKEDLDLNFENNLSERRSLFSFFQEDSQVGIRITNRTFQQGWTDDDKEEAFYRQTFYKNSHSAFANTINQRLGNPFFSFVFYVEIDNSITQFSFSDAVVSLGGEQSAFKMQVEGTDKTSIDAQIRPPVYKYNILEQSVKQRFKRIVLLSDTYADWDVISSSSALAVVNSKPFRYFSTELDAKTKFFDLKNTAFSRTQSGLFNLIQQGSVLYVDGQDAVSTITKHLDNQWSWKNIGYNNYHIL